MDFAFASPPLNSVGGENACGRKSSCFSMQLFVSFLTEIWGLMRSYLPV